MHVCVL